MSTLLRIALMFVAVVVVLLSLRVAMSKTTDDAMKRMAAACLEKGWGVVWSSESHGLTTETSMRCYKP